MDTLKIRFKLHALEYEVEGQQEVAKEEFRNFNENILTNLLARVNIVQPNQTTIHPRTLNGEIKELSEAIEINSKEEKVLGSAYPTLKDVKLRDLPKNEREWFLVYAFYASDFGTKEFTREKILDLYKETERRTDNRIKSLSKIFKAISKSLYIKSTNDTNFIILPKGKTRIIEILEDKSTGKTYIKKPSKANSNTENKSEDSNNKKIKTVSGTVAFIDLKFSITEMNSLKDFFELKSPKTQNDEVAVVIQWYQENKDISGASLNEINYLIKIATNNVPSALGQVLINMKGPKLNLIEKDSNAKYKLTSLGLLRVTNKNAQKTN